MERKNKVPLSLLFALCVGGCYYDVEETLYGTEGCDPAPGRFAADVEPLLQEHCIGCHGGPTPSAGIAFESHGEVVPLAPAMLGRMVLPSSDPQSMPPSGKLDTCVIEDFGTWIAEGSPNN
jgi:hypothetical protein